MFRRVRIACCAATTCRAGRRFKKMDMGQAGMFTTDDVCEKKSIALIGF